MRYFIIALFTFVSVFATDYSQIRNEYASVEEELQKVRGEIELIENRYETYFQELEGKLERISERFSKLREELIRLRKTPAIGYELEQSQLRYKEKKEAMIPVRNRLAKLRKEGEVKREVYEQALAEKRAQIEQLQLKKQSLQSNVTKGVEEAKAEMIAAKRQLLSAIKSRKKNLDSYQKNYQEALERYKAHL